MKKFASQILYYSIIILCIALISDAFITLKLKTTYCFDNTVWNRILQSEMDNDLIVIGSSRAYVQYDTRILDSILNTDCYNLGRDGKRIDIQCLVYNIYKKYGNTPPKTILLDFFDGSLALSNPYNGAFYYPYLWESNIWNTVSHTHDMPFYWRYVPLLRYYSQWGFINNMMHSESNIHKGYQGFDRIWNGSEFDKIDKIDYLHEDTAIVLLDNLLADCTNDGINVVLVHSPIYSKYWDKFPDSAEMWSLYRSFAQKYDIPLLDYTNDPMCEDTTYFYNARHLNRVGAELFTRKLAHDLDSMGYGNH